MRPKMVLEPILVIKCRERSTLVTRSSLLRLMSKLDNIFT